MTFKNNHFYFHFKNQLNKYRILKYSSVPRYWLFKKDPYYSSQGGMREKKNKKAVLSYRKKKPRRSRNRPLTALWRNKRQNGNRMLTGNWNSHYSNSFWSWWWYCLSCKRLDSSSLNNSLHRTSYHLRYLTTIKITYCRGNTYPVRAPCLQTRASLCFRFYGVLK